MYTEHFGQNSSYPNQSYSSSTLSAESVTSFFKTYWMYIVGVVGIVVLVAIIWYFYKKRQISTYTDFFD